jgi:hypothetical protein
VSEAGELAEADGWSIVRGDVYGTAVFTMAGVAGVIWRDATPAKVVAVVVSLVLFVLGIGFAIWSYAMAVERSRTEDIAVTSLYLLMGGVAPRRVATRLWMCWGVQIVVALTVGIIGATGLRKGENNALAFGALVPMFGVGCNGLWAARHGRYAARAVAQNRSRR